MIIADFERDGLLAVQKALDAAAAQGGGQVLVPAGVHDTCGLVLGSHTELVVPAGATLRFTDDPAAYPVIRTRWEGWEQQSHHPLIYAKDAENVSLTGRGVLEGRGTRWWQAFRAGGMQAARPCFVCFENCRRVTISGLRFQNSPAWTLHPLFCEDVLIDGVSIINPQDAPNTDGIDPESCQNVRIQGCLIDVGDDCIAVKAGTEYADAAVPCENVTITGCTMAHGHGGVVLGSEMSGGIRRVTVTGCAFDGTDRGIRVKSRRGRGGSVRDLVVTSVAMHDVACPFVVNLMYFCGRGGDDPQVACEEALPVDAGTPRVSGLRMSNITVDGARASAGALCGLPEAPIEDVALSDVTVRLIEAAPEAPAMNLHSRPMTQGGFDARHVRGLSLRNVRIEGAAGEGFTLLDCTE